MESERDISAIGATVAYNTVTKLVSMRLGTIGAAGHRVGHGALTAVPKKLILVPKTQMRRYFSVCSSTIGLLVSKYVTETGRR